MKGNIPIPELPFSEEVWLMVAVTSVRERRTQQGKPFRDASARNATGSLALKIWAEVLEGREDLKPGLWGITGKLEPFQDRTQFVVSDYKPINTASTWVALRLCRALSRWILRRSRCPAFATASGQSWRRI